jgi:hypothetical protein
MSKFLFVFNLTHKKIHINFDLVVPLKINKIKIKNDTILANIF